jgi:D-alanine-D-alanine ligase
MQRKIRIAVIFGGQSPEHEVSRTSAQFVISSINREKYDIEMIGITKSGRWLNFDGPVELISTGEWQAYAEQKAEKSDQCIDILNKLTVEDQEDKIDVIFPVLHGCNGEDGTIQGLFELTGIPYVGCGVLSSALCMDKAYAKIIFEKEGLPQGKYIVFSRGQIESDIDEALDKAEAVHAYPCFVKPSNAGSSVGVSKACNRDELAEALINAARYDIRILVEEFIDGREVECAVLGNDNPEASVVGEIIPCNEFYDYEAKYQSGDSSKIVIPAQLDEDISEKIREYAVRAYEAIDCSGLSRVDFFIQRKTGNIYINEINTLPGFTSISMYPKLWEASGLPNDQLVDRLIQLAFERHKNSRRVISNA